MTETLHLSHLFTASPEEVYNAWIDGNLHSQMTGGAATSDPKVGGDCSAWDGYISGTYMTLDPGKRIVQTWRTSEFADSDPSSTLELQFSSDPNGCLLILIQTGIPEGQKQYEQGWKEHYFEPMAAYFQNS